MVTRTSFLWTGFVGPFMLLLLVLLVVPFINLMLFSVHTFSSTGISSPDLTAKNYAGLADEYFFTLVTRTLAFALASTVACVRLGYPVAFYLARARPHVVAIGLFFLVMPLMVSAVIRVFGWVVILGRR